MGDLAEARSVEDREERIKQIDARLAELDAEFDNLPMTDEAREEWNSLNGERDQQAVAVRELKARKGRMRQLSEQPSATETARGVEAPAFVKSHGDDIYDLTRIRTASRSQEDHKTRLHDNAKRAIERAAFPEFAGRRETVQEHVERLLGKDDKTGTLAERFLATGNPLYDRAFGKAVMRGLHTLSGDEQRAMSVYGNAGVDGGLAVPFQLDPTVILTSDGTMSPMRRISRVVQIVSKTWQGITSDGITVSRSAEGAAAAGNEFAIEQPEVNPTRVIADVQFSVELDQDWAQFRDEVSKLLNEGKDNEEDTSFVTGTGVGNNPFGVVTTLDAGSLVNASSTAGGGLTLTDTDDLELELPPRFRRNATYLGNKAVYQKLRQLARAEAAFAGDRWVNMSATTPAQLNGYSAEEATAMTEDYSTATRRFLLLGDFSHFLIVDRLGMSVEINPHVVNASGRWTGQRSLVAVWRNSSKILADNAFRALVAIA